MDFSRFGLALGLRLVALLGSLALAGLLLTLPGHPVGTLLTLVVAIALAAELFGYVAKTNREVTRFLDAARYADFGQRFEFAGLGAGFTELGDTFTSILDRFREYRTEQEAHARQLKAMIEHVPVPLLSILADGEIRLWNNAARRLFGADRITRVAHLARYGVNLPEQMMATQPGERALITLSIDGQDQRFSIGVSELSLTSGTERLISLQNIQSELDTAQLLAWRDLVRVLTHEIMNSLTPVSSLAKTASDLVADASGKTADAALVAELDDVKDAVDTVARRSEGLMNFVSSYRQFTRLPEPNRSRFHVAELFADVERIVRATAGDAMPALRLAVEPSTLELHADRDMIEQVLINLLQNARQALEGNDDGEIRLLATLNPRGRVRIVVEDNGPGIAPENAGKIFVPFYTTRQQGSGIGLALSRQMMIANGGSITFGNREPAGAQFVLAF